uniref:Uncharacterized protein n=1 Tax=Panagrellus redivivus TaxID=6233 RepID=A0A7E4VPL0_PANRE
MIFSNFPIFIICLSIPPTIAFKCYGRPENDKACEEFLDGNGLELPLTESTLYYLKVEADDFPRALIRLSKRRLLLAYRHFVSDMTGRRRRRFYGLPEIVDVTYGNHTNADKISNYNSAVATVQAFLNIVSVGIRIVFLGFVVFCVHRFVLIVIKKYNLKNVPNYRRDVVKFSTLSPEKREARKKQLLNDFQTVWRYLQYDSNLSLKDPAYSYAFGKLFEYYLPERGQSIQDAFPLDFFKDPNMDDAAWLKAVLEGPTPSYRLMILSAEERKLAKDASKKKADDGAGGGGGAGTTQ